MAEKATEYDWDGVLVKQWARFQISVENDRIMGNIELDATSEEFDQYSHELTCAALKAGWERGYDHQAPYDENGLQVDVLVPLGA